MKPILIFISIILITGCTGFINTNTTPSTPKTNQVWSYGNFCGSGHPNFSANSPRDAVIELRKISPVDDIDFACKLHDICYAIEWKPSRRCDGIFYRNISTLFPEGVPQSGNCNQVLWEIRKFIELNPSTKETSIRSIAGILIDAAFWPFFALARADNLLRSNDAPCNSNQRRTQLIAPLTIDSLNEVSSCEGRYLNARNQAEIELGNKPFDKRVPPRQRKIFLANTRHLIGAGRQFSNEDEYILKRGCPTYPLVQSNAQL